MPAKRRAAKAPVAICWVAAPPVGDAVADAVVAAAVAVSEADEELAGSDVSAAEVVAADVAERASAVALRVPHCWLSSQTD